MNDFNCFITTTHHRGKVTHVYRVPGRMDKYLCEGHARDPRLLPAPIPIEEVLVKTQGSSTQPTRKCCVDERGKHGGQLEEVGRRTYCGGEP